MILEYRMVKVGVVARVPHAVWDQFRHSCPMRSVVVGGLIDANEQGDR